MRRYGWGAARLRAWRPLPTRLAAIVLCVVAAGGGAITAAVHVVAGDYLTRQADQQLRGYAGLLTSRPFTVFPGWRLAPGASGLGTVGRTIGIVLRTPGGQLLMSAGPAPPSTAGRGWLEVSEPVSYQADHIPFVYGADDTSLSVTRKTGRGFTGTLVVGLDLASVGRAVGSLTSGCLAVAGLVVLLAASGAAGVARVLLRPLALAAETEAAAARDIAERTSGAIAETCGKIRRPLSVLAGLAEYYREHGELADDAAERMMRQVADEAARIAALVDGLEATARDDRGPSGGAAAEKRWTAGEGRDRLAR